MALTAARVIVDEQRMLMRMVSTVTMSERRKKRYK